MRILLMVVLFCGSLFAVDVNDVKVDLRSIDGKNYVSGVKKQSGGTCWTHGTMAALEGNLLLTGRWLAEGESGDANLAEYHLDWWNGFNQHFNLDIAPEKGGLTVHEGGDYRVASAYFARGAGAVRDLDGQSYSSAPKEKESNYHFYYPRDITWYSAGKDLENILKIKKALIEHGVVGTALAWGGSFYSQSKNTFYQPPSNGSEANHAVAIVGWDDQKVTQAPKPGAWLAKNSWGTGWGTGGYFWISYYDKVTGQHPEMGAVSFQNVERVKFHKVYYHDYHGWRDTKAGVTEAFNAFKTQSVKLGNEVLKEVSFYTAEENVEYAVQIFDKFENGELSSLLSMKSGLIEDVGFHTVELLFPVHLRSNDDFYIYLSLSKGGHPFDKTSNVPVLLGASGRPQVKSKAHAGESFYKKNNTWADLTQDDASANFCMKGVVYLE